MLTGTKDTEITKAIYIDSFQSLCPLRQIAFYIVLSVLCVYLFLMNHRHEPQTSAFKNKIIINPSAGLMT